MIHKQHWWINNLLGRIREDTHLVGLEFKVKSKMDTFKNPERLNYLYSFWVRNRDDLFVSYFWLIWKAKCLVAVQLPL